jgi:sugar lactone lactonase YvrE
MVDRFTFDATVTAAGVIDSDNLAVASAAGIFKLTLSTDTRELLIPLEPDSTSTRTNDGRVNQAGGFWIGTMGLKTPGSIAAGGLYQVRAGSVTKLLSDVYIPNSTCFSPDGRTAYFADTPSGVIRKVAIDPQTGLPNGGWQVFVDKGVIAGDPDGAVVDSEGFVWSARWMGKSVVRIAPDGRIDREVSLPVSRVTCPAFGGKDLKTLYITTARENMSADDIAAEPNAGSVFAIEVDVPGLPENLFRA